MNSSRNRLLLLQMLICFVLAGCDQNTSGSISSSNPQSHGSTQSEQAAAPTPAADREPSEKLIYRRQRPPKYPVQAVRERMEGKVVLNVLVDLDGKPEEIILDTSSGHEELDRAAITAVKSWDFNVGMRNGVPVRGYVLVPVEFNLGP